MNESSSTPKIRVLVGPHKQRFAYKDYQLSDKDHDMILIDYQEDNSSRSIILWNMDNDKAQMRRQISGLEGDYDIIWDCKGNPYIIQGD